MLSSCHFLVLYALSLLNYFVSGKVAHKSCQHPIRSYCKHKRGIRLQSLQVEERPPASQVKAVKKRDILQLLRAMGQMDVEATMNFYESICGSHGSDNENNDDESDPNTQVHNEDTW